jgi:anti-sigma factor RsiW
MGNHRQLLAGAAGLPHSLFSAATKDPLMNCESIRERLLELNDGRLDADTAAVVQAHLAACPECRREQATIQEMLANLNENPAPPLPTPGRFGMFGDIVAEKPSASVRSAEVGSGPRSFRWAWLIRAIAACSLLALGYVIGIRRAPFGGTDPKAAHAVNDLVGTLATDPSANVRLNAVEALAAHTGDPSARTGVLISLLHEQSPMVQVAMIDFLVAAKDGDARPILESIAASDTADGTVREAARRALPQL